MFACVLVEVSASGFQTGMLSRARASPECERQRVGRERVDAPLQAPSGPCLVDPAALKLHCPLAPRDAAAFRPRKQQQKQTCRGNALISFGGKDAPFGKGLLAGGAAPLMGMQTHG